MTSFLEQEWQLSRDEVLALLLHCWRGSGTMFVPTTIVNATGWTRGKATVCLEIALAAGWLEETHHALNSDGSLGPTMSEDEAQQLEPLHPYTGVPCEVATFLTTTEALDTLAQNAKRTLSDASRELLRSIGLTLIDNELKHRAQSETRLLYHLDATMCRRLARAFDEAASMLETIK